MAARLDWVRWLWPMAVASTAAMTGLIAGLNPRFAIFAALAFAFVIIVFADLTLGVILFTFLAYFETIPGLSGSTLSLTKAAGALLTIAWFATLVTQHDAKKDFLRQHPYMAGIIIMFIGWAALSFVWSEKPVQAWEATGRLALNAMLFLIVYTAIRTPKDATRVIAAFVIGATAAAALGVMAGAQPTPYGQAARVSGEFENANTLASTLVASLSLSLGLAFALKEHTIRRNLALGAAAFAMLGILLTVSRSGLVALGVAAIAAIIFSGRWRAKVALVSAGVAVSAVIYFLVFAPPVARDRVSHLEGGTGRSDIWKVAWRMSERNPAKGVGAGNFRTSSIHYVVVAPGILRRSDFLVNTQKVAHNVFLETLAELGIVGLTLLLILIVMLVRTLIAAVWQFVRNGDVQMEIISRAALIALFGLLASLFFSSDQYNKQLWLLLSLGPTLLAIGRAQAADAEAEES